MEKDYTLVQKVEYNPDRSAATVTINTESGNQKQFYVRTEETVNKAISNSR